MENELTELSSVANNEAEEILEILDIQKEKLKIIKEKNIVTKKILNIQEELRKSLKTNKKYFFVVLIVLIAISLIFVYFK